MIHKKVKGNPMWSPSSLNYKIFSMAMEGVTIDRIKSFCKKQGCNDRAVRTFLVLLRSGEHRGRKWEVKEKDGYIKVRV